MLRSKISQVLKSKIKGASKIRKAQSANQSLLKMSKRKPKPMKGQAMSLRRERKKKKRSSAQPLWEELPRIPKRDWTRIPWNYQNQGGVLGKWKKESAKIWIAQGSMLIDTRNEDRHVPSVAHDSEKSWWPRNQHLTKRSLVPREMQEGEPWRKMTEDLSTW